MAVLGRSDGAEVKGIVACVEREADALQETAISEEISRMPIRRNDYGGLDTNRFPFVSNYGQRGSLKTTIDLTKPCGHRHRFSLTTQERQDFGNLGIQYGPSCASIQYGEDYAIDRLSLNFDENLGCPFPRARGVVQEAGSAASEFCPILSEKHSGVRVSPPDGVAVGE